MSFEDERDLQSCIGDLDVALHEEIKRRTDTDAVQHEVAIALFDVNAILSQHNSGRSLLIGLIDDGNLHNPLCTEHPTLFSGVYKRRAGAASLQATRVVHFFLFIFVFIFPSTIYSLLRHPYTQPLYDSLAIKTHQGVEALYDHYVLLETDHGQRDPS